MRVVNVALVLMVAGLLLAGCAGNTSRSSGLARRGASAPAVASRGGQSRGAAATPITPSAPVRPAPSRSQMWESGESPVDRAIKLSDKYTKATEELREKDAQIRKIEDANREMKRDLAAARSELDAAKKELTDANAFLVKMQGELEDWKRDVLGFRDEIRHAQAAQARSLSIILKLLGASETVAVTEKSAAADEIAESADSG